MIEVDSAIHRNELQRLSGVSRDLLLENSTLKQRIKTLELQVSTESDKAGYWSRTCARYTMRIQQQEALIKDLKAEVRAQVNSEQEEKTLAELKQLRQCVATIRNAMRTSLDSAATKERMYYNA